MTNRISNIVDFIFMPRRIIQLLVKKVSYAAKGEKGKTDYAVLQAAPITRFSMLFFFFCVGVVLYLGWRVRAEELLIAGSGLGYALGIVGSLMMLMLVLYPLRKKYSFMRNLGPIKLWFTVHMILGTLGPACILFHANFGVGSFNSCVALTFTLLVAASGFFHMYIYTKVHYQLYERKVTLQELQEKIEANRSSLQHIFECAPKLKQRLLDFEEQILAPPHSVLQSIIRVMTIGLKTRVNYFIITRALKRGLKVVSKRSGWPASEMKLQHYSNKEFIRKHMKNILEIVEFSFYERLFAQWYLFHGPLFYMLILVATLHVIAVHLY